VLIEGSIEDGFCANLLRPKEFGGDMGTIAVTNAILELLKCRRPTWFLGFVKLNAKVMTKTSITLSLSTDATYWHLMHRQAWTIWCWQAWPLATGNMVLASYLRGHSLAGRLMTITVWAKITRKNRSFVFAVVAGQDDVNLKKVSLFICRSQNQTRPDRLYQQLRHAATFAK